MLVRTALSTALDRLRRFAVKIIVFAMIVFVVQLLVRSVAAASERFGLLVGSLTGVVVFAVIAYLSFVALRFSYRTLDHPVFDFSLDARGVLRLMVVESILLLISIPSLLVPLALAFSFVDLPEQVPSWLAIQLSPVQLIALIPFAILSIVLLVRFTMAGFRTVVFSEGPFTALKGSWVMTRSAFAALLAYNLIPLLLIFVLSVFLVLVAVPFAFMGPLGVALTALVALLFSIVYIFVIDPTLAIGKAKLFEELSHKAHKGPV